MTMPNSGKAPMTINEWTKQIHANAVAHGWHDQPRTFGDVVALCHSELSEALEEYRNNRPMMYTCCEIGDVCDYLVCDIDVDDVCNCTYNERKPEGIAVEMIDCIIRILDWCGQEGIDVEEVLAWKHEYNKTRPYRHNGKVL